MKKIMKFFHEYGPFNILFTGGEPLITPGISDFFRFLVEKGHHISLQSNVKYGAELFSQAVPAERTGWILTTFHSVQLEKFDSYLQTVLNLKEKGYPIIVKLVLDDLMLPAFVSICGTLKENGIGTILSPIINFPERAEPFPKMYSVDQWAAIAPRITLRSSWLYFAGGWRSRGAKCQAGNRAFCMRPSNGQIDGCAHSYPKGLGNLYKNYFSPVKELASCGLDLCICDFNYYIGIIPGVDDSEKFNALLAGAMDAVPFSDYMKWIKQAGIEPLIDLQPIINEMELGYSGTSVKVKKSKYSIVTKSASKSENLKDKYLLDNNHVKDFQAVPNKRETALQYIKEPLKSAKIEDAKKLYAKYIKTNPDDKEIALVLADFEVPNYITIKSKGRRSINIPIVSVKRLHSKLGFDAPIDYPRSSLLKPLSEWKMEIDDSPIFRYIYRHFRPRRHLEFGTWQGTGALYCLEECDATVWTINIPFGESKSDGSSSYGHYPEELNSARQWAEKIGLPKRDSYKTDSLGFIGRFYLEKGMGNRVCQIYCDSKNWDISNYSNDFFDTVLIDGTHEKKAVINDTRKAFQVLKDGGIVLWHDFCPPVIQEAASTLGVIKAVCEEWKWLCSNTSQLFWIYPSWILVGIKRPTNRIARRLKCGKGGGKKQWTVELVEGVEERRGDRPYRDGSVRQVATKLWLKKAQRKSELHIIPRILNAATQLGYRHEKIKRYVKNTPVLGFLIWRAYMIIKARSETKRSK
jgi:hypothetical protein